MKILASKPGFTFLELLIALSLFSIGMISVLQVFPVNRRLLAQTAFTSQATFLAQEKMEVLRSTPYDDLIVGAVAEVVDEGGTSPLSIFTVSSQVNYLDANYAVSMVDAGLKRIVVTVTWTEHAVSRQYQMSTYVTR